MLPKASPPNVPEPSRRFLERVVAAITRRRRTGLMLASRIARDSTFPLLVLGTVAAALFAAFLEASTEIVLGLLFTGTLTAILETRMRGDNHDP